MKTILSLGIVLAATLLVPNSALAQGETAVPFLLISSSVEGNGMGGISAAVSTDNAMSVIANPGQLGLVCLKDLVSIGTYAEKTRWLPQINYRDMTFNTSAVNAGVDLSRLISLPIPVSLGVGYSRVFLDEGEIIVGDPTSPDQIGRFDQTEKSESFSIGVGVDYLIKAGIGFNFKSIESRLFPDWVVKPGAGKGNASAMDYGVMLEVPIAEIVSGSSVEPLELFPNVAPLLHLTMGYARSNLGDEISYVDPAQRDPLPRNATLGLSIEMGIISKALSSDWKVLSLTWARQVEDILVKRYPDAHFEYQGWFGDIKPFDNLILGKWGGNVGLRKGWQFEVGEIVSVRGGSFTGTGFLNYETSGYSIRLIGFLNLIEAMDRATVADTWLGFVKDHFDLQYHSSIYGESTSLVSGTSFKGINLVVR